jgi:hypothetical protein
LGTPVGFFLIDPSFLSIDPSLLSTDDCQLLFHRQPPKFFGEIFFAFRNVAIVVGNRLHRIEFKLHRLHAGFHLLKLSLQLGQTLLRIRSWRALIVTI